jgi:small multidrug resistance pump
VTAPPFDSYRWTLYRGVLWAAAAYNAAFGLWAVLCPSSFFATFRLAPPTYPSIWSCLGMVVGVYALGYAYAARHPERAKPFVAIGLVGKVLGPIGWVLAVRSGEWPLRTLPLVVFNDLVWWVPFAAILLDGTRAGDRMRAAAPWACAALNALAAAALLVLLRPGTEAASDPAGRAAWIAEHPVAWRGGWAFWMASAVALTCFYAWWGARVPRRRIAFAAVAVCALGNAFDLTAETLYVGWLPDDLERVGRAGTLLTGGVANGLYTIAGILLTTATPSLPRWLRAWAWGAWVGGIGLSVSVVADSTPGMVASTAVLMTLFCPLVLLVARHLRRVDTAQPR